ncbi:hypothetical protein SARI_02114 [Salmonella enterica subsp. arizonae serovar 62:z4,z23:-]|uniref:Uncharacterized protein n=1 Tax=Salmonella arizonae (strain ATCC BAA-731 / CDC346-86 / RSK2980) TaxID=41514 RepID=A9MIT8_SALAR|nr:hypothetical protein SARI_02114 [Salmonella enterica subsp. arizonae serovar 62:z4,z23:-]
MALPQAEMHAHDVDRVVEHGRRNAAIEHAALFAAADRDVAIFIMFNGVARKHCVAVMAFRIDRIAAIGEIAPHGVGQKFIMGGVRPVFDMQRMHLMRAHHFLQTDDIGADRSDGIAQFRQDEAFIKGGKPFVRVNGEHFE